MGFMSPPKPLEQSALFKFLEGLVKSGEAVRNQFEASRYQLKIAE